MSNPFINILIPVYNSSEFLNKLINCFLQQDFEDFKVIFVDDFSTDNSADIINSIAEKDNRFIYKKRDKKAGFGVKVYDLVLDNTVDSDYIMIATHDDYFDSDYLKKCYEKAKETDADIILTNTVITDKTNKTFLGKEYLEKINNAEISNNDIFKLTLSWKIGVAGIRKKSIFDKIGFSTKYYNSDEFFLRKAFLYPFKVAYADTNFYYDNTSTDALTKKIKSFTFDILETDIMLLNLLKEHNFEKDFILKKVKSLIKGFGSWKRKYNNNYDTFTQEEKEYIKNILYNARKNLYDTINKYKYLKGYLMMISSDLRIKIRR